jgi:hypothetical protein
LGFLFMLVVLWSFRDAHVARANRGFRYAQIISAGTMAFGHGLQDAQKTMGIITLALVTSGIDSFDVPLWVVIAAALAISAGTYAGGWRIMRTMGRRIIQLTPAGDFSAQTVASGVMITTATVFAVPVSTTHVHHLDQGCRVHASAVGGALGGGREYRRRLGAYPSRGRCGCGRGLLHHPRPRRLTCPSRVL